MKKCYKKMLQVALTIDVEQDTPPFLNFLKIQKRNFFLIKMMLCKVSAYQSSRSASGEMGG
jgi:hypothetical protein